MTNAAELSESLKYFGVADYAVFILMLAICTFIGLYFGYQDYKRRKLVTSDSQEEAANYLMGGRDMPLIPIALSLTASFVSGTVLLGTATEMYLYGSQFIFITIAVVCCAISLHFVIIPVFHELQITSTYEYLQSRFDKRMRMFGSLVFLIGLNLFLPIVVYVPALAFSQTTGINVHVITPVVMVICIFYTCLGGMKAVVWTDVVQVLILFGTLITIAVKGTEKVGGFSVVWERNMESGRIQEPDLRLDPRIRHSFWTLVVGGSIFYMSATGLNQNMIQRFMAVKTIRKSRQSNWINMICIIFIISINCYNGLLVYAMYHDCDPFATNVIQSKDQLLPMMIMDKFHDLPGFAGLFTAGVFAAALSTLSTAYNSMAAVAFEDIFKVMAKGKISEWATFFIMRGTVFILGCISVALVYVVQNLGNLLQLTYTIPATSLGPMLGVFLIGFCIPWLGKKPTFYSAIFVYFTLLVTIITIQTRVAQGSIKFDERPTSTEGCTYNFTISTTTTTTLAPGLDLEPVEEPRKSVSYLYFTLIGALAVIILSTVISFFTGFEDPKKVNPRLLAPFMRKFIKSEFKPVSRADPYDINQGSELRDIKSKN